MAGRTPKLQAWYEAAHTTERLPRQATDTGFTAQLRIIPLLDRSIERVHVDMDNFSHNLPASIVFPVPKHCEFVSGRSLTAIAVDRSVSRTSAHPNTPLAACRWTIGWMRERWPGWRGA
jgi:hypothetical protein